MPKYKKIEVALFGVLAPFMLVLYTAFLLYEKEAVFIGRSSIVTYHNGQAVLVSLLWFGVSGAMFSQFFLRPCKILGESSSKVLVYSSIILSVVGFSSAVTFV